MNGVIVDSSYRIECVKSIWHSDWSISIISGLKVPFQKRVCQIFFRFHQVSYWKRESQSGCIITFVFKNVCKTVTWKSRIKRKNVVFIDVASIPIISKERECIYGAVNQFSTVLCYIVYDGFSNRIIIIIFWFFFIETVFYGRLNCKLFSFIVSFNSSLENNVIIYAILIDVPSSVGVIANAIV